MSNWLKKHRNDYYYKKAKADNYKSRAAYKLIEMNNKFKILKNVKIVIDLCCAPGSWLQVLERKLSKEEDLLILGVDFADIDIKTDSIIFIRGNIENDTLISEIKRKIPRLSDLLISDCAHKLIGVKDADHARQIHLAERSLIIAKECLRVGGNFITKVFQGDMLDQFKNKILKNFHSFRLYKPKSSPKKSREIYLLAFGLKPINARN
ncbi:MAG: SAM-dependent methyltransferase [Candidatus Helarchaeota archaeon]